MRSKGQVDNKWIKVKPGSEDRTLIAPGEMEVDYRLILLQSSEVGKREASLTVLVDDGQDDASSWSTIDVAFQTLILEKNGIACSSYSSFNAPTLPSSRRESGALQTRNQHVA